MWPRPLGAGFSGHSGIGLAAGLHLGGLFRPKRLCAVTKYILEKLGKQRLSAVRAIAVLLKCQSCRKLQKCSLVFACCPGFNTQPNSLTPSLCLLAAPTGGPQPRVPRGDEAGGRGPDGAAAGVRGHGHAHHPPPAAHPLRRLGGGVRPVGGLRVPRPLPSGLVPADWVPAAASSTTV